jgi:hypothetical protein
LAPRFAFAIAAPIHLLRTLREPVPPHSRSGAASITGASMLVCRGTSRASLCAASLAMMRGASKKQIRKGVVPMRKQHALFVVGILLFVSAAFAQQPATGGQQPMQMHMHMQMPSGQMESMDCEAMMQKMQSSSKAMDDRLQALIDEMNKAKGSARVDRMAAVINELVSQRKQMRGQMMTMMPQMMGHMMQHMLSGGMQSMSTCPMMKGDAEAAQTPAPEHKH